MSVSEKPELSFEELAAELSRPLSGYLERMTGNTADAADLLQETLIRIARGLPRFERRSQAKTWAFRIATNVAIDFFRKSRKTEFVEFEESGDPSDFDDEPLVIDEMNECIRKVIYSLPPDYRAPLILYHLEGNSIEETAEITGISVPAAKVRIHRAKARLREALEKKCDFYRSPEGKLRCDVKKDP